MATIDPPGSGEGREERKKHGIDEQDQETHKRSKRMLFKQTKQDKMRIFEDILFFEGM